MQTILRSIELRDAIRTFSEVSRRAPSSVRCGALRTHCPIAVYDRAPATTADAAISSTATYAPALARVREPDQSLRRRQPRTPRG
ncbi:hypothetical protein [Streptomyces sp. NPDC001250]|uniref:hypothetical protein n=1 Tax=unclassified Streptomyces TaxID=2593676 RepID=UPI00332F28AB